MFNLFHWIIRVVLQGRIVIEKTTNILNFYLNNKLNNNKLKSYKVTKLYLIFRTIDNNIDSIIILKCLNG